MYKFVLVGPHAGKTINLGGYQFVDGVHTLGPIDNINPSTDDANQLGLYLAKTYQAFPEGSSELAAAENRYIAGEAPPGESAPIEQREAEEQNALFTAPAEMAPVAATATDVVDPAAPVAVTAVETTPRQADGAIRTALTKLDVTNDEQWTQAGKPSVEAVRALTGNDTVSRADIERLAPKLDRDEARKLASDPLA